LRQIRLSVHINHKNFFSNAGQSSGQINGSGCLSNAAFMIANGKDLLFHSFSVLDDSTDMNDITDITDITDILGVTLITFPFQNPD
jgi:hypothetical protein